MSINDYNGHGRPRRSTGSTGFKGDSDESEVVVTPSARTMLPPVAASPLAAPKQRIPWLILVSASLAFVASIMAALVLVRCEGHANMLVQERQAIEVNHAERSKYENVIREAQKAILAKQGEIIGQIETIRKRLDEVERSASRIRP